MKLKNINVIVLDVEDNQSSYKKYYNLIQAFAERNLADINLQIKKLSLSCYSLGCDIQSAYSVKNVCNSVEKELEQHSNYSNFSINEFELQQTLLYFRLKIGSKYDITNLQYFYLIKQYLNSKTKLQKNMNVICRMIILNRQNKALKFSISNFLLLENRKEICVYERNYNDIEIYGYVINLPGVNSQSTHHISHLEKFYPLLEIDQSSYLMLSRTVKDTLLILGHKEGFPKEGIMNYYKNATPEDILLDMCIHYYTNGPQEYNKMKTSFFYSEKFMKLVQGMSLLGFLIMCSFEYFLFVYYQKQNEEIRLSKSELQRKINLSTSIASGLLQIIENVVMHAERKEGYFSFRIYDIDSLSNAYTPYINSLKKFQDTMFMEIKICDLELDNSKGGSGCLIVKKFLNGLDERIQAGEEYLQLVRNNLQNMSIRDFFIINEEISNMKSVWKQYYQYPQNWMLHYGLRLYAKIIETLNGFFRVNSQYGWDSIPEEQYYTTIDNDSIDESFLPGTQYNIVIPYIPEQYEQTHIGIDSNINYDKMLYEMLNGNIIEKTVSLLDVLQKDKETWEGTLLYNLCECSEKTESVILNHSDKSKCINYLKNLIATYIEESEQNSEKINIPIWDMRGIEENIVQELFSKAIWESAINCKLNGGYRCVIKNCSYQMMLNIVNVIAVFFGLNSSYVLKHPVEIYICGIDYDDDFLISGSSYVQICTRAYKYAASRGQFSEILSYLFIDLTGDNYVKEEIEYDEVEMIPFDLLIKDGEESRFIKLVEKTLENKITSFVYGCKLENIHVRIGSKIHVGNFYEAELLFQDSYFSKRMAYLVAEDIMNK
ncbi:MAG: hypothetical protein K2K56_08505, partial [Lachnospiraceae bacterium]|nr:hypothetical protein [Lachnospiraceae bacterium]